MSRAHTNYNSFYVAWHGVRFQNVFLRQPRYLRILIIQIYLNISIRIVNQIEKDKSRNLFLILTTTSRFFSIFFLKSGDPVRHEEELLVGHTFFWFLSLSPCRSPMFSDFLSLFGFFSISFSFSPILVTFNYVLFFHSVFHITFN